MANKLNQIIAIEKGVKGRVQGEVVELQRAAQKPDLFLGFAKTYLKKDEEGEDYPPERKKVTQQADEMLVQARKAWTELIDTTASKDYANTTAKADVTVDGHTLVKDAPVTFLLFLEKQLGEIHAFIDRLPVLDESEDWTRDENSGLFRTGAVRTGRTKKVQKPIVLYDATEKHPAQTQLVTEDVLVGYWETVKQSGALPVPRKRQLLERCQTLINAVKEARETANEAEAASRKVGEALFGYLVQ